MRTPRIALLLALVLPIGSAATGLAYLAPAELTPALVAPASLPITVSAGPDGSTSVGPNATSAGSTVTAGILSATTHNTTVLRNTAGAPLRVRLVLVSTDQLDDECVRCDLVLRHGATSWSEITIAEGDITRSTGEWATLEAGASPPSVVWVHAIARGKVLADRWITLTYRLEIEPAGGGSPSATYTTFTTAFRV